MRVLGIIPARGGSKRVPGKNLRKLGGKELVARAIETCCEAKRLDAVLVSSDDEQVFAVAARYPKVRALKRPPEISGDQALAIEYVRHALAELEKGGDPSFDAVAIVQPSSPFTTSADVDRTVTLLAHSPGADSAVTVMEIDHATHPVKLKRLEGDRLLPYLEEEQGRMAAHQLPKLYVRNCSVYVTRRACLEKGSILGDDSRGLLMPRERSLDINDELDWSFAEFLHARPGAKP